MARSSVASLNDALLWRPIEGAAGHPEVQLWLSAHDVAQSEIESFESRWLTRLTELFG